MKEKKYSPYGTFSAEKINAPKKPEKGSPAVGKTVGKGDLRCGKKA